MGLRYWDLGARSSPSQWYSEKSQARVPAPQRGTATLGCHSRDSGSVHSKTSCGSGANLMEVNASGLGLQQWSQRNSRSILQMQTC